MKIGIDARLIQETGVGRYIRNLIKELARIESADEYVIFLKTDAYDAFRLPDVRFQKRLLAIPWHSLQEQIFAPIAYLKEDLDLLHIPYFTIPILYPKPMIVTMHDLTILHFNTGKATTLPSWIYALRRLGYGVVLKIGLKKAKHILTVSNSTRNEIMNHFGVSKDTITVTYEGVDSLLKDGRVEKPKKPLIPGEYILYVGNAYPHKNLDFLLQSFDTFLIQRKKHQLLKLVLVGRKDFFYQRLEASISSLKFRNNLVFFGAADERTLSSLYFHAKAYVFPSLSEGFGLPALEALSFDCPVICSEISVFKEILKDVPIYFDPLAYESFAQALNLVLSGSFDRKKFSKEAHELLQRYSWKTMVKLTHDIYLKTIINT